MSGDNLRRTVSGESAGHSPDERLTPLVGGDAREPARSTDHDSTDVQSSPDAGDPLDGDVAVDASLVTESLDEILLAMIASASDGTHGTGLMDELERQFDTELSPGTVYPRLHELEADGILEMHELVHTKQYSIADGTGARSRIERAVSQHLAIATFLQTALDAQ